MTRHHRNFDLATRARAGMVPTLNAALSEGEGTL